MLKKIHTAIISTLFLFSVWAYAGQTDIQYQAIFTEGKKIGYLVHTLIVDNNEVRTIDAMKIDLIRFGKPMKLIIREVSVETVEGEPIGFKSVLNVGSEETIITGTIKSDGKVKVITQREKLTENTEISWPEDAIMANAMFMIYKEIVSQPGHSRSIKLFCPGILQALDLDITVCEKEEVKLIDRVAESSKFLIKVSVPQAEPYNQILYLDAEGTILKNLMPMMGMDVEFIECEKEFALSANDQYEIGLRKTIPSPKPLMNLGGIKSAIYKIQMNNVGNYEIPESDNQTVKLLDDETVIVEVHEVQIPKNIKFPYEGNNKDALEALKPTYYVQSDDEKIVLAAKKAIGNTKNAVVAVERIEKYVADYIEGGNMPVAFGTASEVFKTKQGDCSEYAALTAALCRAVGIPVRIVSGYQYRDELYSMKNLFLPHAWNEVFLGNKWITVDSTTLAHELNSFNPENIILGWSNGELSNTYQPVFTRDQFKILEINVIE